MTPQQLLDNYAALPANAQRQVDDFIALLWRKHPIASADQPSGPMNLTDEAFIGMWRDRSDMNDGVAWTRNIRRLEWIIR